MKKGFLFIFWGLIFNTVDFNIGSIDFFPDFIGFLLIYLGCKELKEKNINFKKSSNVSLYVMFFSFIQYILFKFNLVSMQVTTAILFYLNNQIY